MSRNILPDCIDTSDSEQPANGAPQSPRSSSASPCATPPLQKVWCAPMTEAGEWVITWTRVPGAIAYEAQTSLDGRQWNSSCRFSGTRAVVLIGPARRCWARVRAITRSGPAPWSAPGRGEKEEHSQKAA